MKYALRETLLGIAVVLAWAAVAASADQKLLTRERESAAPSASQAGTDRTRAPSA